LPRFHCSTAVVVIETRQAQMEVWKIRDDVQRGNINHFTSWDGQFSDCLLKVTTRFGPFLTTARLDATAKILLVPSFELRKRHLVTLSRQNDISRLRTACNGILERHAIGTCRDRNRCWRKGASRQGYLAVRANDLGDFSP